MVKIESDIRILLELDEMFDKSIYIRIEISIYQRNLLLPLKQAKTNK